MASTLSEKLTNNQAITITLGGLPNGSYRQSTAIDNTTNQDADAGVLLKIKTGSGVSANGTVGVYAYGSADGGITYTDGASGSDAAITPTSPVNLIQIGIANLVAINSTYYIGPFSVAKAFGYLPGKWGIVVFNNTGGAFDATEGNFAKMYERVQYQST